MKQVLIVDDDANIREVVRFALENAGFTVHEAEDGQQALQLFSSLTPDLIVLDITMPELDGTEVCRSIRKSSQVPIFFLTSRDDEIDRVLGLEIGGDDYITKPFSPRELVARVKAFFRRFQQGDDNHHTQKGRIEHGYLTMDPSTFVTTWNDQGIVLTATEFDMLAVLLSRPGQVFSRQSLMDGAYNQAVVVSDRTIDSHIRRIRGKFREKGGDPIQTVHGVGFKLGGCDRLVD